MGPSQLCTSGSCSFSTFFFAKQLRLFFLQTLGCNVYPSKHLKTLLLFGPQEGFTFRFRPWENSLAFWSRNVSPSLKENAAGRFNSGGRLPPASDPSRVCVSPHRPHTTLGSYYSAIILTPFPDRGYGVSSCGRRRVCCCSFTVANWCDRETRDTDVTVYS